MGNELTMGLEICDRCEQEASCLQNGRCFGEVARSINFSKTIPGQTTRAFQGKPTVDRPGPLHTGIAGEDRPGGGRMPYLDENRTPINHYRYLPKRRHFEAQRDRARNAPKPDSARSA